MRLFPIYILPVAFITLLLLGLILYQYPLEDISIVPGATIDHGNHGNPKQGHEIEIPTEENSVYQNPASDLS